MGILGQRVRRSEDARHLTGASRFVADLRLEGGLHVTYVRATLAHGRLVEVNATEARQAPGVADVILGADVDLAPLPPVHPFLNLPMTRPWLASDVVRFVGEPVAAVVSETPAQGADAAGLVEIDYDPLPVVLDPEEAIGGEVLLFPGAETNVAFAMGADPDPALFDGCEVVVSEGLRQARLAPCPLEVRAAAAAWSGERLTQWACTQFPHQTRDALARCYGLAPEQVRVVTPDVGGGFGSKTGLYPEEALLPWIARRLGRPVRWAETRSESMVTLGHGRAQVQRATLGGTRDGLLLAYHLDIVQDAGAYPVIGALLPFVTSLMAPGVYDIGRVATRIRSAVTNTTPTTSYRGAGRPEATAAIERMVDRFAAEVGMDPAEVRRRNLVPAGGFPYSTAAGAVYDSGDYAAALDLALGHADYKALRAEQRRRREAGHPRLLGIGLGVYVEVTNPLTQGEFGAVEVTPGGGAVLRTGTSAHGQGHETTFAMLVAEATGIPVERIEVRHGDTAEVARGEGTSGSRSVQNGGSALSLAAAQVVEAARRLTATILEASPDDVVLDREAGAFHVAGTPAARRTWAELAAATELDGGAPLAAEADFRPPAPTYPFGAHVAVVEVDVETGAATLVRMVAVDDAGTIINPLLADGQVHGGLAQGIAQALYEEFCHDADGNPLTTTLADYGFPGAPELPSFERQVMETPTPHNPLGAKGIGESGTIGAIPAVHNAVIDALSHLGVRHVDPPCTPERVWRALRVAAEAGREAE